MLQRIKRRDHFVTECNARGRLASVPIESRGLG